MKDALLRRSNGGGMKDVVKVVYFEYDLIGSKGRDMNKTILVIEDEATMRELLKAELANAGYKVYTAANGEEGIKSLHAIEPDLIICDRVMPIMSGYQLLERIRGVYPQYNSLPFIFLTALDDNRDRHSVGHLEPTAYLRKPIDYALLRETIEQSLTKK